MGQIPLSIERISSVLMYSFTEMLLRDTVHFKYDMIAVKSNTERFLADRTIGRAYGTVCRLSSVCLSVTFCIVAKRCVLAKKCLKK